jgi:serine carboxypeptidase-like clade IV
MLDFLQEFLAAHPELKDNDFYVTGESYAGHYVPAVSHRIWKANKDGEGEPINFKGLAIGMDLAYKSSVFSPFTVTGSDTIVNVLL